MIVIEIYLGIGLMIAVLAILSISGPWPDEQMGVKHDLDHWLVKVLVGLVLVVIWPYAVFIDYLEPRN